MAARQTVGSGALIQVKAPQERFHSFPSVGKRKSAMPTDVAIVVAGIVLAFLIFAGSLAWADHYSKDARH
jgi:hypothetical protein